MRSGVRAERKSRNTGSFASYLVLLLLLLGSFALRIYRLDQQSLWGDEIASVFRANLNFAGLGANLLSIRNHVPLYFLLLHLWQQLAGQSEFSVRFFSLLWGLLSISAVYRLGSELGKPQLGLLSAFLLSISPFHIWYSQETRMYTMVTTLATGATYFLLRALLKGGQRRSWLAYEGLILAAIYTHYLALLVPIAHLIFLFLKRHRRSKALFKWMRWTTVAAGLYLPWVILVLTRRSAPVANQMGWIPPTRWHEPLLTLYAFGFGPTADIRHPLNWTASLGLLGLLILGCHDAVRGGDDNQLAAHWLFTPLLITTLVSWALTVRHGLSLYMDRYLALLLPAFVLLLAQGILLLARWKRGVAYATLMVILVASIASLSNGYFVPSYWRDDWKGVAAYLRQYGQESDLLVLGERENRIMLYYYDPGPIRSKEIPQLIAGPEHPQRIWLLSSLDVIDPHRFPESRNRLIDQDCYFNQPRSWFDQHYPIAHQIAFTGICLTLYQIE